MRYAIDDDTGRSILAVPHATCHCPGCGQPVVPKCGTLRCWHFAHEAGDDCDAWAEGESDWHQQWKEHAPQERCEVVMENHRADIVSADGLIIELQHSPIDVRVIREREVFYRKMIWLFDARSYIDRIVERHSGYFVWRHARLSILSCSCPVYLDTGYGDLIAIHDVLPLKRSQFHDGYMPRTFTGHRIAVETFIQRYISEPVSSISPMRVMDQQLTLFGEQAGDS